MEALPLNKEIYERATAMGIKKIELNFSGGSDEGYLSVSISTPRELAEMDLGKRSQFGQLESLIEKWAEDAYDYSGAGDGTDYGDDIVYDLENKTVETSEWYTVTEHGDGFTSEMEISDDTHQPDSTL